MGGAQIKFKRDARNSMGTQHQKNATNLVQKHYVDLKAKFDRLNPADKRFYVDQLDAMYTDLGTTFEAGDREEFECAITDISDFAPFMEAMVEWNIAVIEHKNPQNELNKQ